MTVPHVPLAVGSGLGVLELEAGGVLGAWQPVVVLRGRGAEDAAAELLASQATWAPEELRSLLVRTGLALQAPDAARLSAQGSARRLAASAMGAAAGLVARRACGAGGGLPVLGALLEGSLRALGRAPELGAAFAAALSVAAMLAAAGAAAAAAAVNVAQAACALAPAPRRHTRTSRAAAC